MDLWLKDLRANSSPDLKIFLIGNRADLEESRQVSKEQALQFKEDWELDLFMEVSSKTGYNIQEMFIEASKLLYFDYKIYYKNKKKVDKISSIDVEKPKQNKEFIELKKYIDF